MGSWDACRSNIHSRLRGLPYASSEQAEENGMCCFFLRRCGWKTTPKKYKHNNLTSDL